MKKILSLILSVIILFSCGENKKTSGPGKEITNDPVYKKGLALVAKNKCLTCHAVNEVITGPPYKEIARKYASYPDTIVTHLANKVITGGNGVWGEIFMTPHPSISKEDAEAMVRYVLMLKE
jgi:cytochrome c